MLTLLRKLFETPETATHGTYIALVARARNPFFYETLGVPDTLDGRFEMILLHLFLLQHRLMQEKNAETDECSRQLSESFFADMDQSVRELGVSDSGVRYRIKAMAKAYHGRLQAYTQALDDEELLRGALARNLYGTVAEGSPELLLQMAAYVRHMVAALKQVPMTDILSGEFSWPELTDR